MPETTSGMAKLKNEKYVKEIIEGLGGVKGLAAEMREYHEIVTRMRAERAALTDVHPNLWVAMGKNGVLAVGDSMDDVLEEVESRGMRGGDIVIELLDTNPPLLIL